MIELLAPAGDLEKLKTALIYGADAVFVGGQNFSLRARASNFSIDDIKEATDFAHGLGKKVYITTNIIIPAQIQCKELFITFFNVIISFIMIS